jgi:hypothetical protein
VSRGTQIPEYVLKGCLAALKSRNPLTCLYSNPGPKLMHGKLFEGSVRQTVVDGEQSLLFFLGEVRKYVISLDRP